MTRNGAALSIRKVWKQPETAVQIGFAPTHGVQTVVIVGNMDEVRKRIEAAILGPDRFTEWQGAMAGSSIYLSKAVLESAVSLNIVEWCDPIPEMRMPDGSVRPPVPAHYQPV